MPARRRHRAFDPLLAAVLVAACGSSTNPDVQHPGAVGDGQLAVVLESIQEAHDLPALAAVLVRDGELLEQAAVGSRAAGGAATVTIDDRWHSGGDAGAAGTDGAIVALIARYDAVYP